MRQLDAGTIGEEEFDAQRKKLMVQDDVERWWVRSRKSGEWRYHDGRSWVRGTPPGYAPPPHKQQPTEQRPSKMMERPDSFEDRPTRHSQSEGEQYSREPVPR